MATRSSLMIVAATAVCFLLGAAPAGAQMASSDDSSASASMSASPGMSASSTKAQRKAARKAARARKNAELKQLEKNGYSPSRNNLNYPDDIQKAEKKAGAAGAASQ